MDCRKALLLAGGALVGLAGCGRTANTSLVPPPPNAVSQAPPAPAPVARANQEPLVTGVSKFKPETVTSVADVQMQIAADESKPPAHRRAMAEAARKGYQAALADNPKCAAAHRGLVRLYVTQDDPERAAAACRKSVEALPREPSLWYDLASLQAQAKDFDGATVSLKKALELDPDNRLYAKQLGFTLARLGRTEAGFDWLRKSMPEHQARCNLARLMRHMGNEPAAREQAQLALRAKPDCSEAVALLGGPAGDTGVRQAGYQATR